MVKFQLIDISRWLRQILKYHPDLAARYRRLRSSFARLKTTSYNIARDCNMQCHGCLFFEGSDFRAYPDNRSLEDYKQFFAAE